MGASQSTAQPAEAVKQAPFKPNNNDPDTVVIPVDASKQAEAAFLWYVNHVHKPDNIVRIIHCQEVQTPSPVLAEHAFKKESWVELMEKAKAQGAELVEKYDQKLNENHIKGSVSFVMGRPGESVIGAAEKYDATMIVMGSRGFGMLRRTILGSVSEYVIHHTKVPVTVVPNETTNWFF